MDLELELPSLLWNGSRREIRLRRERLLPGPFILSLADKFGGVPFLSASGRRILEVRLSIFPLIVLTPSSSPSDRLFLPIRIWNQCPDISHFHSSLDSSDGDAVESAAGFVESAESRAWMPPRVMGSQSAEGLVSVSCGFPPEPRLCALRHGAERGSRVPSVSCDASEYWDW